MLLTKIICNLSIINESSETDGNYEILITINYVEDIFVKDKN